jgi:hypothetical protein
MVDLTSLVDNPLALNGEIGLFVELAETANG